MAQINLADLNNPEKTLIRIYNATQACWKDSTGEIDRITPTYYYGNLSGYKIQFRNSQKAYPYRLQAVQIYQNPTPIDRPGHTLLVDGVVILDYAKILRFGPFYKVFLPKKKPLLSENVEFQKESAAPKANLFQYYRDLARFAAEQKKDPDSVEAFVAGQYNKIDRINSATALYAYLSASFLRRAVSGDLIFPFSFNLSQKEAVRQALANQVSVIEGPPGCGKTQTILNIIANLVIRGQTAAVVSNNNTAIKNIADKLAEERIGFIAALLGNRANKAEFFDNLTNDELHEFLISFDAKENMYAANFSFAEVSERLDFLHAQENLKAIKSIELGKVKKEQEHFLARFAGQITPSLTAQIPKLSAKACLRLKIRLENASSLGWFQKIVLRIRYRIHPKTLQENLEGLILAIDDRYYNLKIAELNGEIAKIAQILAEHDFERLKKDYEGESKKRLHRHLLKRYQHSPNEFFSLEVYKREFPKFVARFPIILSTSFSLMTSIDKGYLFDYLIIDEASQSDLLSSVLAMSCAKNLVVVGDSKQLDQIDNTEIYDAAEQLALQHHVDPKYAYRDNSLLGSVRKVFRDASVTLLKEHYRCQPKIINFINEKYYDNQLVIMTKEEEETPITIVKLVEGNHARKNPNGTGQYNQREIDEVDEYLKGVPARDIGIISPYRIQVQKYQEKFKGDGRIEVDTVHKFQGRQKEAIILSTVVNQLEKTEINERFIDFINNPKLFNVALSRARKFITLVTTHGLYNSNNNNFSDFIKYAEYNLEKSRMVKGKVTSVFDMLYSDYTEELYTYLKRHQKSKDVITEVIIFDLLNRVLVRYPGLKVAMHVPLHEIIKTYEGFSAAELSYLQHNWTHVDFLIYNRITKENLMAVEVDGVRYHEQRDKQAARDSIKNKTFERNSIRLLRIKTNESNEEGRIQRELEKIFGN